MQVALISRDESLHRLCREVLEALPDQDWTLSILSPGGLPPAADIHVWDWDREAPPVLSQVQGRHAHLLIIARDDARAVLADLPLAAVTLLLKPVNRDTLRTCLEQAAERVGSARADRDAIFECLLATALRLQEYDQDRMNFLARAVHDFRTPLTAVHGYCGLLLSGQIGPLTVAQKEVLERTSQSVRRLSRLATALFQWSSGVRVGMQSQRQEGDIDTCFQQALHEIRPLAAEKSITVQLDLEPPGTPLRFDAAQIEQLLVNLLENSCKFTPRGGYIQVRAFPSFWERRSAAVRSAGALMERRRAASRAANAYRIEVSDNGMGVRPEHLETIFQEYTSYGGGGDRSGSGLGLAICKRILAEHGGQIFAESGNQGVTFVSLLPFTLPAPAEHRGIHLVAETVGDGKN
ncbi:MAG TPA: HAMP domain-containing sensor histidine kinase [Bryobacteraceae bacterium]|nr:HAMP domain-containing sensor histidine kinase [Bryobacteraceae bacterium]